MPQVMLDVGVLTVKDLCLKFNDDEPHYRTTLYRT